jgi:hypothetical protein
MPWSRWPEDEPVPAFGPRMVCTGCGVVGADARPNWTDRPSRASLTGTQWRRLMGFAARMCQDARSRAATQPASYRPSPAFWANLVK